MQSVVNLLIQLQELQHIRDEQKVTKGTSHLQELDASIKSMTEGLPPNYRTLHDKLLKKDHIVIAPISDGICAVCGMKLPISLIQSVRLAREIHSCLNCARMLYFPESGPRHIKRAYVPGEPIKAGISRFSSHSLMLPNIQSQDKEGAIQELAYKIEAEGFVDKADKLVESAMRRESIYSTAFEYGLAFPHVRNIDGGGLTLALGISKKGIDFHSSDNTLTKLIFFLVIPTAASAFYLKLLAGLTETFIKPEARKAILAEKDSEKMWKTLIKITRSTIK